MRTIIGSDFHIGSETTNYPKLNYFFEYVKLNADKFIICGDCLDLWRCDINTIRSHEPYKTTYNNLLKLAETIPTTIIPGNHDYNIGSLNLPNIEVRKPFFDDGIFFTHGWEFDVQQRIGSYFYGYILKYFPYFYQKFFKTPNEIIKDEYDERSFGDSIHVETLKFAKKNNCQVIMGHTHSAMISDKVIDCGDMVDSLSYIIIDNDRIELRKLDH